MTNAELKFMETVPASLHRIAAAAEKIAEALSHANMLKELHVMAVCGDDSVRKALLKVLAKEDLGMSEEDASYLIYGNEDSKP